MVLSFLFLLVLCPSPTSPASSHLSTHASVIPTTAFLFEDRGLLISTPPFLNTWAVVFNLNFAAYTFAIENLRI